MNSTKFLITPFLNNPLDGCFCINTIRVFKNNVTHIFRLSIYSAWFEDWEQAWAQYFKPLAWSLFSTQSNICDGAFFAKIVNSWYCYNQKQSSGGVLQKRCSYEFCKIYKKTPALTRVFNEAADLQSLTYQKKRSRHICFIVNSAKFLITPLLKDLRSYVFLQKSAIVQ